MGSVGGGFIWGVGFRWGGGGGVGFRCRGGGVSLDGGGFRWRGGGGGFRWGVGFRWGGYVGSGGGGRGVQVGCSVGGGFEAKGQTLGGLKGSKGTNVGRGRAQRNLFAI